MLKTQTTTNRSQGETEESESAATSLNPRPHKNRTVALLLEIVLGSFGLPGIGWIYSGRAQTGCILLACYLVFDLLQIVGIVMTSGLFILCSIPLNLAIALVLAFLLNNAMRSIPVSLQEGETLIKEDAANYFFDKKRSASAGKLWLTNHRLVFKSHSLNTKTCEETFSISDISLVWQHPRINNRMVITQKSGQDNQFMVRGCQDWIQEIASLGPALGVPENRCDWCVSSTKGRYFTFYYGRRLGSEVSPTVIPYVMLGADITTRYSISGSRKVFLCHECVPTWQDEDAGSSKAIQIASAELKKRGYDAFFTPKQYNELKRQSS